MSDVVRPTTHASFTESLTSTTDADGSIKHFEDRGKYEVEYTITITDPDGDDQPYWVSYNYDTVDDLLDVWFTGRVFPTYDAANTVYDTLTAMGVHPDPDPADRLVTDVDRATIPVDDTLDTLQNVFEAAVDWVTTESVAQATSWAIDETRERDAVPRSLAKQVRRHAGATNQATCVFTQSVEKGLDRLDAVQGREDYRRQDLRDVRTACDRVYSQFISAWLASSKLYDVLGEVDDQQSADDEWPVMKDSYRDAFETSLEYAGHHALHAKRLQPKLDAHLRQAE